MKTLLTTLNSKYIHTALSLRYLEKYAVKQGISNIKIKEFTINQNIDFIMGEIYREKPDILGFSVYIWNVNEILEIIESIKYILPNIKILLGGPEVSYDSKDLMRRNKNIDIILIDEGEVTFAKTLKAIKQNEKLINIESIVYRDGENIVENSRREHILDLNEIPVVYGEDLGEYKNKIIYYESSRGCPFKCKFCLSSVVGGVRYFKIDRIKRDMQNFLDNNVKQIKFIDRTFNANKKHMMEIVKYIVKNDNGYTNFHFEITAHMLDDETIEFFNRTPNGLFQFEIGVQSTNEETTDEINRVSKFEEIKKVVNKLNCTENIHIHLDLIAGLPYETYEIFKKSFNDVYGLKPDKLQLGFLKLLKGSELRSKESLAKHEYRFYKNSPYEVLENKYISYKDILKLKDIEEIVETYGNGIDFEYSLKLVMGLYDQDYFMFFEDFSVYLRNRDYFKVSHSKVNRYKTLYKFYKDREFSNIDKFKELLRFDFIRNTKSPNVPDFLVERENITKEEKISFLHSEENMAKYFSELGKEYSKINAITHFEKFKYNILKDKEEERYYLFKYNLIERNIFTSEVVDITEDIRG